MSLPREHKKSQSAWLDLAVFAGVLAFLGYSLHSFVATHSTVRVAIPKPEIADAPLPATSRSPASQTNLASGSTEILRIPCLRSGAHSFTSNARLMQIHAPFCPDDDKDALPWRGTNESSGEEILVFVNRKEKSLSTSYFNLREGRNDLTFVQDIGKGRIRREKLQITRKVE